MVRRPWRVAGIFLGILGAMALVSVVPAWLLQVDIGAAAVSRMSGSEHASSVNAIRGQILQGLGAIAVLSGAVLAWRQLRQSAAATRDQIGVQREGQLTDRYTRAVDQLSSANLTVRIGGIYALDRIARESESDRPSIVNVLASHLRSTTPWPPRDGNAVGESESTLPLRVRRQDAQTALSVICRWTVPGDVPAEWLTVDLSGTDLRNGNMANGSMWHARFTDANLAGVNLREADLRGADFTGAILDGADLTKARADRTTWWPTNFEPCESGVILISPDGNEL